MENFAKSNQKSIQAGISVLMPVHGSGTYLETAIAGVLSQTYTNFEFLIIFDRPTPSCRSIVEKYQNIDSRIKTIDSFNPGISAALNLGLSESCYEYVARIDADDLMLPNRLKTQVEYLIKNPTLHCVGSQVSFIGEEISSSAKTNYPEKPAEISKALRIRNVMAHPSVLYKKSKVLEAGSYREEYNGAEDYDLWLRLDNRKNLANIHDVLTMYRVHEDQETARNSKTQLALDDKVRVRNLQETTSARELEVANIINATLFDLGTNEKKKSYTDLATIFLRILSLSPKISLNFLRYFVLPNFRNR